MSESPCADKSASPLEELAGILQCRWKNIEQARERTKKALQRLSEIVESLPSSDSGTSISVSGPDSDTSVVVHGSLARYECTNGSDLDWTLLVDGVANPATQNTFLAIKDSLYSDSLFDELGLKKPGREGTFGALSFSQPLVHYIGGEEDSNSNTTRRVLLLLEAVPIGKNHQAFRQVRTSVLRRYLNEDRGLLGKSIDGKAIRWVPLFLLNDFSRYWRTMAVDFAYKQFDRGNEGYALRSIKLGMSRKLLFASGLLACFWCDPMVSRIEDQAPSVQGLIDCLDEFLSKAPLERIALFFVVQIRFKDSAFLRMTAKNFFDAYDEFLGMLDDKDRRKHLATLKSYEQNSSAVFLDAREIRHRFRAATQELFMGSDSPLQRHSIEKGIF